MESECVACVVSLGVPQAVASILGVCLVGGGAVLRSLLLRRRARSSSSSST